MKQTKFIGVFKSFEGHIYELEVYCHGFLEAFFLLTADAIRSGKHYQLYTIENDSRNIVYVSDIIKCCKLLN
jgi:hypothetical protein